jgi:hypothetical protein
MSLNNVASLLLAHGDLVAARPLLERALAIYEKGPGPEHPLAASTSTTLRACYISRAILTQRSNS